MALPFPSSPTNGQTISQSNGVVYTWDSTLGAWLGNNTVVNAVNAQVAQSLVSGYVAPTANYANTAGSATTATTASSCTGNSLTATTATYLSGTQQVNTILGVQSSMSMSADSGATRGSFVTRAAGTGDANLSGMTFWNDSYSIKMGVRADGTFGIGGWSRPAWSWYSDASGNMVAAGDVTAYSDPRLKENFKVIENPLEILSKLDGGTFNWKTGIAHTEMKAGKKDIGILADQVLAVLPELVHESIDIDGEKYLTVAYDKMIPVLIEAIKVLEARIKILEK